MEQVHHHWILNEEEEEEEEKLHDDAFKGRQSVQYGKDSIIATDVTPSFSSMGEQLLLQKEEVLDTQKEEQKEYATQEVEETSNAAENDNDFNDDSEAAGLEMLVNDFVENAMNGDAIGSATINVAASQKKNSVYFGKQEGFDIQAKDSDIQCSPCNEVNNQRMEIVDDRISSGSELLLLPNSSEIQAATIENHVDESSAKEYHSLSEEIEQQLKELDVEAVLEKQETHDLFCPNCKSCITKRVILRKRKRNIPNVDTKAKRDKLATEVANSSVDQANQSGHAIATPDVGIVESHPDNCEPERAPRVFRCLSCFSFFIPMRNGFKLFPSFGGTREPEISENHSIVVEASNANWFMALFTSNNGRKASAQGDATIEDSRIDNPESPVANTPSQNVNLTPQPDIIKPGNGAGNSPIPSIVKSVVKIESLIEKGNKSNVALPNELLVDQNNSSTHSSGDVADDGLLKVRGDFSATKQLLTENVGADLGDKNCDSVDVIKRDIVADVSKRESVLVATVATTEILLNAGKPAKDAILKSYEGSPIFDKSQKDADKSLEIAQDSYSSVLEEAQSPAQSFGNSLAANDVANEKQSSRVDATIPSNQDFKDVSRDIEEEIKPSVAKEKEEAFITSTSQTADSIPIGRAIVTETQTEIYIGEQPRAEIVGHQEWEILKSIVYGGLVESITSLGVVSSAAASGTAPVNIIALGLANLIGGLFVIGHNVIDLKNDHFGGDSLRMNVQDRYQELLGHRENFLLHAVVAVLSFLIFGSVPVVVYGLLITKNYYSEVKITAVAAASVVCIIMLAFGKVYTNRPPKSYVKTVLHYVTLALATSGISYIAGDLVKNLLEKISGSESGYVLNMPVSGTTRMKPAWMSY